MSNQLLHPDRLFPIEGRAREIARELYRAIKDLPIISPHGHVDPKWFAQNERFVNPTELILAPDHYLYRMLYSQGIPLDKLGVSKRSGFSLTNPRQAWREFAAHYYLFRGTPSAMWLDHVFSELFDLNVILNISTADKYFDVISAALERNSFLPRALFDSFNIEVLATTESPIDSLEHHRKIRECAWEGRVIPTYRPDVVVDPEHEDFAEALLEFGHLTGENVDSWQGYLNAHRNRREDFINMGATATDHGHTTARTAALSASDCEKLYSVVVGGRAGPEEAELFRAQMLTEMARMSLDDGLVMQIHAGSHRNHNDWLKSQYGHDKGADIPQRVDFVNGLKPLLSQFGNDLRLSIILFTLDESTYSRELAPMAGHYPCLKLGPPWWFYDSPEGMRRFREQTTEIAGFYNTVGFNDDTRGFLSIPARHDVARRMDCNYLASLVDAHRLRIEDAHELALDLTYTLPKCAYRLETTNALNVGIA